MKLALLSCGPSLPRWESVDRSGFAAVVGVNRAVAKYPCDWWSVGDAECFWSVEPIGSPRLWTHDATIRRIGPTDRAATYHRDEREPWTIFSSPAALLLAPLLNATSVVCFGVDMAGTTDWDGTERGNRTETRWTRERDAWAAVVTRLANQGIAVVRA